MHKAIGAWVYLTALAALATPAAADDQTTPCQVLTTDQQACPADPQAVARWTRKRLKELDEQAATARLNRESNRESNQDSKQAPPPPAPRQAVNLPPPPAPAQYRSALEEYQALREAYDRQLRAYYRAFPAQASARPPASAPTQAELTGQDAARADAWHGYQNGPGNGY